MKQIDPTTAARVRTPILIRLIHSCGAGVRALVATGMALALALLVLRALAVETLTIPVSHPTGRSQYDPSLASETEATSANGRLGASREAPAGAGLVAPTAQVSVLKAVRTGTGDDSLVFNGDWITYTITISNDAQINDVVIRDSLLDKNDLPILENVKCRDCYRQIAVVSMPEPLGGVVEITFTQGVSWRIASLAPGVTQREFWGRVTGQSDGTILSNRALVQYDTNEVATSNIVKTPVRVRVETPGGASVSAAPTWLSADMGGTISMDWGDYDADGDLDLVLGSSLGATIYENVAGQLLELRGDHAGPISTTIACWN